MTVIEEAKNAAREHAASVYADHQSTEAVYHGASDFEFFKGLDAFLARLSELGYVVVPKEPTEAMHRAGMDERRMQDDLNKAHHVIIDTSDVYRAMITASPDHRQPQQEDGK